MMLSLDPGLRNRRSGTAAGQSGQCDLDLSRSRRSFRRYAVFLAGWAALSTAWTGCVAYDVYHRAQVQAEMARDVEQDLDQGLVPVSCDGPRCDGSSGRSPQQWADIASTYIRFGSVEMSESVLVPPAIILVLGLGAVFLMDRRRRPS